jgi:hypothetical protein
MYNTNGLTIYLVASICGVGKTKKTVCDIANCMPHHLSSLQVLLRTENKEY